MGGTKVGGDRDSLSPYLPPYSFFPGFFPGILSPNSMRAANLFFYILEIFLFCGSLWPRALRGEGYFTTLIPVRGAGFLVGHFLLVPSFVFKERGDRA